MSQDTRLVGRGGRRVSPQDQRGACRPGRNVQHRLRGPLPRVAALVAVAFVAGVGWGAARTTAQPGSRVFTADVGMVISHVKAGQAVAFERTMKRVGEALTISKEFDRRRQAVTWKIYKASDPLDGGALLYISLLDPVVPGADYWVPQILNEAFPTEVQELYETYAASFAEGQGQLLMNLTAVDLGLPVPEP